VALKEDLVTIDGVTFDHKGETPGLGAEINTTEFESQFPGKNLYRDGTFVGVKVLKGNADPQSRFEVDGISGGTITSKGLEAMVYDGLIKYEKYLSQNRK